jgi:FMN phosphatase YigB (HAD superfamily)
VEWLSEFHKCLEKHGLSLSEESFVEYYKQRLSKVAIPIRDDGLTFFERRIQTACSDLEVNMAMADIRLTATTLLNVWDRYVSLDLNCLPVLETLASRKSKALGLISNFDHPQHVHALVRKSGLEKLLTTVVVSGDVGVKKPDPAIFHLALQRAGLQPKDTIYIGDAEEDVVGANSAGMISVIIDRNGHGRDWGQTYTVTSLRDILELS